METITNEKALIYNIAIHLSLKEINALCRLGELYDVCDDNVFWKDKFYYDYGHLGNAMNWKGLYDRYHKIYSINTFKHMSRISIIEFIKKITLVQIHNNDTYIPQIVRDLRNYVEQNEGMLTKQGLLNIIDNCNKIVNPHTAEEQHQNDILSGAVKKLPDEYTNNPLFMGLYLKD